MNLPFEFVLTLDPSLNKSSKVYRDNGSVGTLEYFYAVPSIKQPDLEHKPSDPKLDLDRKSVV